MAKFSLAEMEALHAACVHVSTIFELDGYQTIGWPRNRVKPFESAMSKLAALIELGHRQAAERQGPEL